MDVIERLRRAQDDLTTAERRVGELLARQPQRIAFGTVAELAAATDTGGATVVRFANKLGFEGFRELQQSVQSELTDRLRPAAERIATPAADDLVGRTRAAAAEGIAAALEQLDEPTVRGLATMLSATTQQVWLLSGDASAGLMATFAQQLAMLRPGVRVLGGTAVAVLRDLADLAPGDVVLALDFRRYDQAVVEVVRAAVAAGGRLIALTDSPLSPLAANAEVAVVVTAANIGPFDSYLAAVAVLEVIVAATAAATATAAGPRLARIEALWRDARALDER